MDLRMLINSSILYIEIDIDHHNTYFKYDEYIRNAGLIVNF